MRLRALVLVWALSALACAPVLEGGVAARAPELREDGWPVATPDAMGIDARALAHLSEQLASTRKHGIDAVVIARRGHLVYEAYTRKGGRDELHDLRSATKSITALLIGLAQARGKLAVDDLVNAHLPPELALAHAPTATLADLLTMRSGLDCDDRNRRSPGQEERMYRTRDWVAFFAQLPAVAEPGERSAYCTGGLVALGEVLRAATGEAPDDFARDALFEPLGISEVEWAHFDGGRGVDTGGHLELRARDFAKIGELVRRRGEWGGERILPEAWIAEATTAHTRVDGEDYGYAWWLADLSTPAGPIRVWYASGNGGQTLFVVPELELVVAFTGRNYNSPKARLPFQILAQVIVPAVQ